ncbi:piggyBac transposable element-derived protein 2-like [Dermacentor andersoni]|uniref:piggyBac transposable element-derived protein 2-like n=1 Tax=Dermacentor andersoni TaxID=34620 RepID=UPI003B3AB43E
MPRKKIQKIPCSSFYRRRDPQTLNDILNQIDAGEDVPSTVAILPPENHAAAVTDEESGDEECTSMDHMPGSTLRAEVLDTCSESSEDENDQEPPAKQQKRRVKWDKRDLNASFPTRHSCDSDSAEGAPLTPVEAFEKFFDDEVINLLVANTNTYAQQKNRLLNVNAGEMRCFLGILLLSGYVPVPRRRMLWENSRDSHNELVANSMRRDRFEAIFTNLHVADNNNLVQEDKFTKLRPLFRLLNERFLLYAPLLDCLSIDESMCEYFGKHGCKQFMKGKPIRFGYKLWCICTPLGYLLSVEPYQGRYGVNVDDKNKLGLGGSVVTEMVSRLKERLDYCFHVFFDNFFSSLKLVRMLSSMGVKCTGTVRDNRIENCPILTQKEMKSKNRGFYDYKVDAESEIIVCRWKDNSTVTVVSNAHGVEPTQMVKRYSRENKSKVTVEQPFLISSYNGNMGGVDRLDENISKYRTAIRGKKWYSSLLTYLVDACVNNAFQLYRIGTTKTELTFRRTIAVSYMKSYGTKPLRGKSRQSLLEAQSRFDRIDHTVIPQEKQTRCAHCHEKTTTRCEKCDIGVHVKCFKLYHSKE